MQIIEDLLSIVSMYYVLFGCILLGLCIPIYIKKIKHDKRVNVDLLTFDRLTTKRPKDGITFNNYVTVVKKIKPSVFAKMTTKEKENLFSEFMAS